ncbi:hypothetical protein [Brevundimonas sp.]
MRAIHPLLVERGAELDAAWLWKDLGLRERFDAIHYAADLGVKPSRAFYEAVEDRGG